MGQANLLLSFQLNGTFYNISIDSFLRGVGIELVEKTGIC